VCDGKLKEAADEFEIKGRAKILGQTEPQWGLSTPVQDLDGKIYHPTHFLKSRSIFAVSTTRTTTPYGKRCRRPA